MESNSGTPAASTTTSLANRDGKARQHLERAAAHLLATSPELQSLKSSEVAMILLAMLQAIVDRTTSEDVIVMATYQAQDVCLQAGIDAETFGKVSGVFSTYANAARRRNRLAI